MHLLHRWVPVETIGRVTTYICGAPGCRASKTRLRIRTH